MDTSPTRWQRMLRLLRALMRRDLFTRVEVSPTVQFHGSEYGGWAICPSGLEPGSRVYSLGVGEDISFDLSMIETYQVEVFAFDPTPRVVTWLGRQDLPDSFHFQAVGAADSDGTAKFHKPPKSAYVSHSVVSRGVEETIDVPMQRLSTLMRGLGHNNIDILKMDIEGSEYGVISDLLGSDLRPTQLLVEYHHRFAEIGIEKTAESVKQLHEHGYRIFYISPNGEDYSFIRTG